MHAAPLPCRAPRLASPLQVDDKYNARAVQRMVGKLASHDWALLYTGFLALVDAKAAEVVGDARRRLRARADSEERAARAAAAAPGAEVRAGAAAGPGGEPGREGAAAGSGAGPSSSSSRPPSSTADAPAQAAGSGGSGGGGWREGGSLRGGLLSEMERCIEGASTRWVAEPDVLLAASGQGEEGSMYLGPRGGMGRQCALRREEAALPTRFCLGRDTTARRRGLAPAAGRCKLTLGVAAAATPRARPTGPRPDAGIWLCAQLLAHWEVYRRALDLFVSRCGPLGARVEAARQAMLAGPSPRGSGGAAVALTIPHVRPRGRWGCGGAGARRQVWQGSLRGRRLNLHI
jgi:hypothetical protein